MYEYDPLNSKVRKVKEYWFDKWETFTIFFFWIPLSPIIIPYIWFRDIIELHIDAYKEYKYLKTKNETIKSKSY